MCIRDSANDTHYFSEADYYTSKVLDGIDFRAKNLESFDSLEKNSVDLYASVRSLYLQDRYRKIRNIDKTTDTLSDDDWEELNLRPHRDNEQPLITKREKGRRGRKKKNSE